MTHEAYYEVSGMKKSVKNTVALHDEYVSYFWTGNAGDYRHSGDCLPCAFPGDLPGRLAFPPFCRQKACGAAKTGTGIL